MLLPGVLPVGDQENADNALKGVNRNLHKQQKQYKREKNQKDTERQGRREKRSTRIKKDLIKWKKQLKKQAN
jgi:hypothetical protein